MRSNQDRILGYELIYQSQITYHPVSHSSQVHRQHIPAPGVPMPIWWDIRWLCRRIQSQDLSGISVHYTYTPIFRRDYLFGRLDLFDKNVAELDLTITHLAGDFRPDVLLQPDGRRLHAQQPFRILKIIKNYFAIVLGRHSLPDDGQLDRMPDADFRINILDPRRFLLFQLNIRRKKMETF